MATIGFLHTSPEHVSRFDGLVQQSSAHRAVHVVDEALLLTAAQRGVVAVGPDLRARLRELWERGADAVICTCSTLGAAAEDLAGGRVVLRVDRPMMRRAVTSGHRIIVLMTLSSTVDATMALIREEAARADVQVDAKSALVPNAWEHFRAGKHEDYVNSIVSAGLDHSNRADVIVLAQASMADAARRLADCGVEVLASPTSAVEHVVAWLEDSGPERGPDRSMLT